MTIVLVTTMGAVGQLADPAVFEALRRDPQALAAGEWWRIATPLLVLDGIPWLHYASDTLVLVVVGSTLEWHAGALRWSILFIAGALAGQLLGYAWQPTGAGASVGICGLVGGLAVVQFADRRVHFVSSLFAVGLIGALASAAVVTNLGGSGVIGGIIVVIACVMLINVIVLMHRASVAPRRAVSYVLAVVAVGALVLLGAQDNHGAALLAGAVVGFSLFGVGSGRAERVTEDAVA